MNHLITGLSHIGIKTMDSKKSVDFYKNLLGFQHYYHTELESGVKLDFLRAGSCIVELICSPDFDESVLDTEGTVAHVAMEVLNIEELIDSLKKAGVDTWQSEKVVIMPNLFPTGSKNIFFKGPSGESLEFFEHGVKQNP